MNTQLHEKWFKSIEQAGETSGVELETQSEATKKGIRHDLTYQQMMASGCTRVM